MYFGYIMTTGTRRYENVDVNDTRPKDWTPLQRVGRHSSKQALSTGTRTAPRKGKPAPERVGTTGVPTTHHEPKNRMNSEMKGSSDKGAHVPRTTPHSENKEL